MSGARIVEAAMLVAVIALGMVLGAGWMVHVSAGLLPF